MCNYVLFFFFNDTATTEIYTLSLHDALPIWAELRQAGPDHGHALGPARARMDGRPAATAQPRDRKSTRLNSSHSQISYAVFCLKKKKYEKDRHLEVNNQHMSEIITHH